MNRIKELRQKQGLTLVELGKKLNMRNNTLSQYETGKREPKLETWQKLANFFGVSVPYLQGLDKDMNGFKFPTKKEAIKFIKEIMKNLDISKEELERSIDHDRIKGLRKKNGLSQSDVANALHITRQAISQYETGDRQPRLETWQELADYFGVTVPYLQGFAKGIEDSNYVQFKCCDCHRTFRVLQKDTDLVVACPFCKKFHFYVSGIAKVI